MNRIQRNMKYQVNKYHRESDFEIENKVFLSLKNYKIQRSSRKLIEQNKDFFEILEKIENNYRLRFFINMKINSMLSSDKLRKTADNFLSDQINVSSESIEIEKGNE